MAAAATQLQITIITPQWLDLPEHEKENTSSSSSSSVQQQQNETLITTNSNITPSTTTSTMTEDKTRKFEPIHDWQKQKFDEWLAKNSFNMYPTRDEKEKLAEMLSASYVQITRLFANQRRRIHKKGKNPKDDTPVPPPSSDQIIPEISIDPPEMSDSTEIKNINDNSIIDQIEIISKASSDQSAFSPASNSMLEEEENNSSVAAICSAVADLIHVDQENKKSTAEKSIPTSTKKKSRKRKLKKLSFDDEKLLETTVDEILHKIGRKDSDGGKEKDERKSQQKEAIDIQMDEDTDIQKSPSKEDKQIEEEKAEMPSVEVKTSSSTPNSDVVNNSLLSMVNEVVNQPPNALHLSAMGDVNPRLVEAMHLLNNGVSWTHPTILSVVIQIHQYQQQQREIQLAQQRAYLASRAINNDSMETSPPPGSESSYSHSSSKSTEELMSSLSPDECLAVNVLTDLAMAGNW